MLLMRLVVGSHMYGLAKKNTSDIDLKEIYTECEPLNITEGNIDYTRWPLGLLMKIANRGGHNGLEVLFAAQGYPEIDLLWPFRSAYRISGWTAEPRFISACRTLRARGDEKGEIRAIMLEEWLEQLHKYQRFNPHWRNNE